MDMNLALPVVTLEEFRFSNSGNGKDKILENINVGHPRKGTHAINQINGNTNNHNVNFVNTENDNNNLREARTNEVRNLLNLSHLSEEEAVEMNKILHAHSDLFYIPGESLGYTNKVEHSIPTTDEQPIHTKQYRFPPIHKEEISKQIKNMLDSEIITTSESPYNSPLWIVHKKPDSKDNKKWRLVIDFRKLNEKTVGDAYPLPNITEILDQLGSWHYFSTLDLASGFHQIKMSERDASKTAFSTPYMHYQFKRMPFGLKNAPVTFQRLIDVVLSGLQGVEMFVYLDDIVIYAKSLADHAIKFAKLAERLRSANLRLQPDKCRFLAREVTYLGHVISSKGVKPDPEKVSAVRNYPRPQNAKNIKQFLGLVGYYRRFIDNYSTIAKPLSDLTRNDRAFKWEDAQETAFTNLREILCKEPLLQYPDFSRPFVLTTDASGYAIGAILSQGDIGKDLPVAYASRKLSNVEERYSTIEKELLAIVYAVKHFRPYLYGRKFMIVTDHKPLVWLKSVKDRYSRLARWDEELTEYIYEIIYKAGKINLNADALSRNLVPKMDSDEPVFPVCTRQRTRQMREEELKTSQLNQRNNSDNGEEKQEADKNELESAGHDQTDRHWIPENQISPHRATHGRFRVYQ